MRKILPASLLVALLLLFMPGFAYCCEQFTSFTFSDVNNCEVQLTWTFLECGVSGHYDVQYSTDGLNFGTIDQLNSTGAGTYTWTDQYAHPATYNGTTTNIFYRLVFVSASPGVSPVYSIQVVPGLSNSPTCSVNNTARCNGISGLSISGPSPLCGTSGGTYTLNSSSYAVNWNLNAGSTGATLSPVTFDGNTATVTNTASASGTTLLLTTLIEGCDLVSIPITLGVPPAPSQMIPSMEDVPPASIAEFNCPGATFWPTPTNGTITQGQNGDDVAIRVANVQSGNLIVRAETSNACGTSAALSVAFPIVPGSGQPLIVHKGFVDSAVAVEKFDPDAKLLAPIAGMYPNPAMNTVQVVIPLTDYTKTFIKVYDLNGHLLKMVVPSGSSTVIDVSQQARGTYILQIFDGKQLTSQKLVRQ